MIRKKILVTGALGFVGSYLAPFLLEKNDCEIVLFDKLKKDELIKVNKRVSYVEGNIMSERDVIEVFEKYGPFVTVYHLAAEMPNKAVSDDVLWKTNVKGTFNLISEAVKNKVKSFVFTSSNVAYGIPSVLPVTENSVPTPLEVYGRSKVQAEKELEKFKGKINIQIFRCPVIAGIGRLGLQAILYEFISEDKNVYVLGKGLNKYQFVDVVDVCQALEKASTTTGFDIYNIGADNVMSLKELYEKVIEYADSKSKIVSLPMAPALFILSILDKLNISPLGVYQYTMMGRSLYMDTTKIKKKLKWVPKKTNLDTFLENYKWYKANKGKFVEIGSGNFSSNRSLPKMGAFKLVKMFS